MTLPPENPGCFKIAGIKDVSGSMAGMEVARFYAPRSDFSEHEEALKAFHRDGVVAVDGIFARERVAELLEYLHREYPSCLGFGGHDQFQNVGNRRFFAPIRFAPPFDCADIIAHPILSALLSGILGDKYVFEAFGVISSLSGAAEQHIHRDGGMLFTGTGIDRILPPSAVTVAIPLVDMDSVSGATAFWPGSHRNDGFPNTDAPFVAPEISVGSLLIWDYRVFHRGLANRGMAARPLIYLTVCRPFWIDYINFKPGKNEKLLVSQEALDRLDEKICGRFIRAEL